MILENYTILLYNNAVHRYRKIKGEEMKNIYDRVLKTLIEADYSLHDIMEFARSYGNVTLADLSNKIGGNDNIEVYGNYFIARENEIYIGDFDTFKKYLMGEYGHLQVFQITASKNGLIIILRGEENEGKKDFA